MEQVTWSEHVGSTFASDLGLRPGHWPSEVTLPGRDGVERTFVQARVERDPDGDVASVKYACLQNDEVVFIFND